MVLLDILVLRCSDLDIVLKRYMSGTTELDSLSDDLMDDLPYRMSLSYRVNSSRLPANTSFIALELLLVRHLMTMYSGD